jgi:hypothetical protein
MFDIDQVSVAYAYAPQSTLHVDAPHGVTVAQPAILNRRCVCKQLVGSLNDVGKRLSLMGCEASEDEAVLIRSSIWKCSDSQA